MWRRTSSALLLFSGLALAFAGQYYLHRRRAYAWDGLLLWTAALAIFVQLMRRMNRRRADSSDQHRSIARQALGWLRQQGPRVWIAAGGALLAGCAGLLALRWPEEADYTPALAIWALGVTCFLGAASGSWTVRGTFSRVRRGLREQRGLLMGLAVLAAGAFAVRAANLEHIPANLGGDEGTWGMEGLAMWRNGLANPFTTRWFAFPSMSFLAWGASIRIFGHSVAGLRMLSALIGTATVLTTFGLADALWGRRVAWMAAILLACSHYHLHYSRLAVNNIADGLFITAALWALVRGLRSGRPGYYVLAGAATGAGWYGYFGARLIGLMLVVFAVWRALLEPGFLVRRRGLLVLLISAALVVAAPLLIYYSVHPEVLTERANQVSIFASGWLSREQEITGRSAVSLLWQQTWKSLTAFHYTLDPTFWYHASIPLLDAISGVLLVLGLLEALRRWREPGCEMVLAWFWLAIVLGWVVTENPPSSQRLVIVAPALTLLAGLGLDWFVQTGQRVLRYEGPLWKGAVAVVLAATATLNLVYYFAVYTPTRVYGNPTAETTTVLARVLAEDTVEGNTRPVYFYGAPFIYWDFGTLRYLAHGVEGADVPPVGEGEPPAVDTNRGARFVFLPERLTEMEAVRARYPGGMEHATHSDVDGRLLYVVYNVGPAQGPQGSSEYPSADLNPAGG